MVVCITPFQVPKINVMRKKDIQMKKDKLSMTQLQTDTICYLGNCAFQSTKRVKYF